MECYDVESNESWSRDASDLTGSNTDDLLAYYFPTSYKEKKRMSIIHSCGLFQTSVPMHCLENLFKVNEYAMRAHFPSAICAFVTVFGEVTLSFAIIVQFF